MLHIMYESMKIRNLKYSCGLYNFAEEYNWLTLFNIYGTMQIIFN